MDCAPLQFFFDCLLRPGRLWARSVASIVKARVHTLALARGKTEAEADELANQFSGHSMRAGYATTAGAADMPSYASCSTPGIARMKWSPPTFARDRSGPTPGSKGFGNAAAANDGQATDPVRDGVSRRRPWPAVRRCAVPLKGR